MTRLISLFLLGLLTITSASAQSVVGTAIIEGREVQLMSNNTWRFAPESQAGGDCRVIDGPVTFCGPAFRWQVAPVAPSPAIDVLFQVDDRNYAMMVIEGLGRADGLTEENLREAVLLNAGAAAGLGRAGVPMRDSFTSTVGDKDYPTISYEVTLQGLRFTYLTTLIVEERSATQLTTYSIGDGSDEARRVLHDEFLSYVQLAE